MIYAIVVRLYILLLNFLFQHFCNLCTYFQSKINFFVFFLIKKKMLQLAVYRFGFLGSIDSNTGSPDLGWDTDQFPMDTKNCTLVMKVGDLKFP